MASDKRILAGAMSGTSADGVDVALVEIVGRGLKMSAKLLRHHHRPYDSQLKSSIFRIRERGGAELRELAQLSRNISLCCATAVNEVLVGANLTARDLAAVAAHGQTLYHDPPDTMQWFDPALVASEVGCAVVSDFRRADCAAGGQGAPLVPFADYILLRHPLKRVVLNIGGIANITVLKADGSLDDVIAFDTGPGNCISDWLCRTRGPFNMSWDVDGAGARRGRVEQELAETFLSFAYFSSPWPKSTDGSQMISAFEHAMSRVPGSSEFNDLLATAAYVTARSIHRGISSVSEVGIEVIASGGGTQNRAIMKHLHAARDPKLTIRSTDELGLIGAAKEAIAFALLGAATLDGIPSNVPSVTGAKRAVVLGSITPKP